MYKVRTKNKSNSKEDASPVRAFKYFFDNCKFYLLLICTSPLHTNTLLFSHTQTQKYPFLIALCLWQLIKDVTVK